MSTTQTVISNAIETARSSVAYNRARYNNPDMLTGVERALEVIEATLSLAPVEATPPATENDPIRKLHLPTTVSVMAQSAPKGYTFWPTVKVEVCAHCLPFEVEEDEHDEHDVEKYLFPCATIRALGYTRPEFGPTPREGDNA